MTQDPEPAAYAATSDPVHTGNETVDAVLATVAGLEERALEDHAAVFESAQERLRHALDAPGQAS